MKCEPWVLAGERVEGLVRTEHNDLMPLAGSATVDRRARVDQSQDIARAVLY